MKHLGLDVELFVLMLCSDSGDSVCFDHNNGSQTFILSDDTQDKTKITKR